MVPKERDEARKQAPAYRTLRTMHPTEKSTPSPPTSTSSLSNHDEPSTAPTSVRSDSPDALKSSLWPASMLGYDRPCPPVPNVFPPMPKNRALKTPLDADVQTPDNWINRSDDLIRLTGKHPFNVETQLSKLYAQGFLTPHHLHFVRNHGAVPRVDEDALRNWTIRIYGLVEREVSFSIAELKANFDVVTLPVTLVCAGNRRKEQNVLRKSLGFNWGAAGNSTALWTGVYLADVLDYVRPVRGQAKHVIFNGGDALPQGPYGTSQRLSWARSKERGMLIAWQMNGLPLEPDHGFPVRVIIPGQIGGRSVKWLQGIEISEKESQHHLHFWDNKVLPRHLSPDDARGEPSWWYDPRYLITELNVNSAIACPDHGETLDVSKAELDAPSDLGNTMYTLRGYAYSGGGRRVTRCEVTLDNGAAWKLAEIEYPEDLYRQMRYEDDVYGTIDLTERDTCFCWCFWSLQVPLSALAQTNVIQVCAMDESSNMQPRDMYPNATSMMNNWMFRVAVLRTPHADGVLLRFEHPTSVTPGAATGWMERLKANGQDPTRPHFGDDQDAPKSTTAMTNTNIVAETPMTKPGVDRKITLEELHAQDKEHPWFVVRGEVYDGTTFLKDHPGGGDSILLVAGDDASEDFMAIHSADGRAQLAKFHIGTLVGAPLAEPAPVAPADDLTAPFLDPKRWKSVVLSDIKTINHDSAVFRFSLQAAEQAVGLPTGQHVYVRLKRKDTGEVVQRAYTPVSKDDAVGYIDFLIKMYLPSEKFPEGGKMTTGFHQLQIGDSVELKGPLGSFLWKGQGTAMIRNEPRTFKEIGMVCAGSGITPVYQVLRAILHDRQDTTTRIWLVCSNRSEADILMRDELSELYNMHGQGRFLMHHTLSQAPENWTQGKGRVTDTVLGQHLPAPSEHSIILACGPDAMMHDLLKPGLSKLGWDTDRQLVIF